MKSSGSLLPVCLVILSGVASLDAGEIWQLGPSVRLVLGQPDFTSKIEGSGLNGMSRPSDIAVDPTTGKVFVVDYVNHRVLRFAAYASLQNGAVLGQPDFDTNTPGGGPAKLSNPRQATVDHEGRLWVSDTFNGRVLQFDSASQKASGGAADGVLGQSGFFVVDTPSSRSVMGYPFGVAVDAGGKSLRRRQLQPSHPPFRRRGQQDEWIRCRFGDRARDRFQPGHGPLGS